jgi:hypothetical protein
MRILDIFGYLTALSPIHSGSDVNTGNEKTLKTLTENLTTGPEEVPVISGNAVRGVLRRLIMADLLERVDYAPIDTKGQTRLYHSLFEGGVLETVSEKDSGYIDLALKAQMRAVLPAVALLGGAIRNQMIEGKLDVGYCWPRCVELQYKMWENPKYPITATLADLRKLTFNTRRDEMAQDAKKEGMESAQMLYTWEYIPGGTVFQHLFTLRSVNEVETACFGQMIALWGMRPRLGGKSATGNGVIRLDYEGVPDPAPYLGFVEENKDDILKMLQVLEQG